MQESNTLSEVSCYTTLSGHSEEEEAGTAVGSVASVATLTQAHGVSCSLASDTRLVETQRDSVNFHSAWRHGDGECPFYLGPFPNLIVESA